MPSSESPRSKREELVSAYERLRLFWIRTQLKLGPTERQRLFALTIVIGGVCGLVAVAFHQAINFVTHHAIDRALGAGGYSWIVWTILLPTLGGLGAGALLEYVAPNARGSGIPQVKAAYAVKGGRLRLRDSVAKFLLSTFQIGMGASLGREGPTVHICAGLASTLGRVARVSPRNLRRLLPVGGAAGIAAAFNAPIAAVTFTVEEIVRHLDQTVLSGVIVAAALAAVVERSVLGEHPMFTLPVVPSLEHASSLILYAFLGLVAAVLSVLFTESLLKTRLWFRRLTAVPRWAHPGIGGFLTGLLAAGTLWTLGSAGVAGGGYATLAEALSGGLLVRVMIPLCLIKLVATVVSYASGGSGGIFAPALFIGGMAGGAVGALDMILFDHAPGSIEAFALVGMGAVFAGTIRAPITSVLIIVEMTDGYSLILPLMIANMSAYLLARRLRPTPIYEALLEQDGLRLHQPGVVEALDGVPLSQVPLDERPRATFSPGMKAGELVRLALGHRSQELFPVVDPSGRLVGVITHDDLDLLASEPHLDALVNAMDVMRPMTGLKSDDDLHSALEAMSENGVGEMPVVDADGRVIGFADEGAIARAHLHGRQREQV